jgi:hypothetical protein
MFEELFEGPIARARQCQSPFPEERRRFLSHLKGLGYARSSLKAVACELIVIAARLDLSGSESLDAAVVEAAARRWATHQIRRQHSTDAALSTQFSTLGAPVAALSRTVEGTAAGRGVAISPIA